MASLAEASLPSLPDADIEALQAQLLQRGSIEPDATSCATNDNGRGNLSHNSEVPETQDAATASPRKASQPSVLRHALSAPLPPSVVMNEQSSSQPALLATTFHGDLGGDTQVNDTQVYQHFHRKTAVHDLTTPKHPTHMLEGANGGKSLEQNTYTHPGGVSAGETGSFLDLNFSHMSQDGKSDVSDMDSPLASPQSQLQKSATRRASFPETPQLAGHKRGSDGQMVESALRGEKTPAYDELFGPAKTPLLTTTQLFQRTQAVSSPLPVDPRSDPVLTRPSPNMQDNSILTSNFNWTSPNEVRHNHTSPAADEPRENYVSMAQSQNRRTQFHGGLHTVPEEIDLFDSSVTRKNNGIHLARLRREQALTDFKSFNAPARPSSSAMAIMTSVVPRAALTNQHANGTLSSPPRARAELDIDNNEREPIDISDDDNSNSDAEVHDDAPNDEYNEFAQTVVRSSARPHHDDDREHHAKELDTEQDADMEDEETMLSNVGADIVPGSQSPSIPPRVFHTTQPTSLMGSQTVPQTERRSLLQQQLPSTISVIPGSQYPSVTSQQLAAKSQSWSRSQQPVSRARTTEGQTPPSSPPMPDPFVREDDQSDEDMAASDSPSTVTKTYTTAQHSPSRFTADEAGPQALQATSSNDVQGAVSPQAYATAPTQPSPLKPRPQSNGLATASQQSMATPLKRAGARRAADIANMPTQRTFDHELSAEMEDAAGVLNEFRDYALSPAKINTREAVSPLGTRHKKRRRTERTIVSSNPTPPTSSEQDVNIVKQHASSGGGDNDDASHKPQQTDDQASNNIGVTNDNHHAAIAAHQDDQHDLAATAMTPHSVKAREAAGSAAVSQLIASRPARETKLAKLSGPGKRTYSRKDRLKRTETTTSADPNDSDQPETSESVEYPANSKVNVTAAPPMGVADATIAVTRPHRVFALFKDARSMYFPATLTGQPTDAGLVHVRFDDGSESSVKSIQLAPLDLRAGDVFKVDIAHMRNNWVVQSFAVDGDVDTTAIGEDIYGHRSILALPRGGKRASRAKDEVEEPTRISISDIYLQPTMLAGYQERGLTLPSTTTEGSVRPSTPSRTTTTVSTPKSRSGRQAARKQQYMMPSSSESSVEPARAQKKKRKSGDVFANMIFAVTSSSKPDKETARRECVEEIEDNGGTVIDDFEDLFETLDLARGAKDGSHASTLRLKASHRSLGFVALISDKHCRKTKYTQALALGIPTLSMRWVADSLDQARKSCSGTPQALPWSKYLLPAGESAYLDGAIRSRTLAAYGPNGATFQNTINRRELLLDGHKVLVVMPRKDKPSLVDKRKSYAFLTLAIGAGDIRPVEDIAEAANVIMADATWTYVMVDSNVRGAAEEFEHNTARNGRRRKSAIEDDTVLSVKSKDGRYTIISHEYIMQSLLLGALVD